MKSAVKPGAVTPKKLGKKQAAVVASPSKKTAATDASSPSSSSNGPKTPKGRGRAVNAVTPPTKAAASPSPSSRSKSPVKRGAFGRAVTSAGAGAGAAIANEDDNDADSPQKVAATEISSKVKLAYKLIQKSTGALGGNGTTGAIYGELTMGSFQKVINYLREHCGLTHSSRFIDVGSGLGKPNFHAAQDPVVRLSIGVELEAIRRQLAMKNLSDILKKSSDAPSEGPETDVELHSSTYFLHMDIDQATTLNPFTHIYMYDLGFPPDLQESIAKKFNTRLVSSPFSNPLFPEF